MLVPLQMVNHTDGKTLNAIFVLENPSKPKVTTVKLIFSLKSYNFIRLFSPPFCRIYSDTAVHSCISKG